MKKRLLRLDEHAAQARIAQIVDEVESGNRLAVVADAGTPGVSDPGALLVNAAYEAGLEVDSIPGPSAVTNALALSGFFAQRYVFVGFLPRKPGPAAAELEPFRDSTYTIVLFESPHRVTKTIEVLFSALGERRAAVCREMTKVHQDVRRGWLSELAKLSLPSKGEYTIVVEGKRRQVAEDA